MNRFENSELDETIDSIRTANLLLDIFKKDITKEAKIILPSKKKNKSIFANSEIDVADIGQILADT